MQNCDLIMQIRKFHWHCFRILFRTVLLSKNRSESLQASLTAALERRWDNASHKKLREIIWIVKTKFLKKNEDVCLSKMEYDNNGNIGRGRKKIYSMFHIKFWIGFARYLKKLSIADWFQFRRDNWKYRNKCSFRSSENSFPHCFQFVCIWVSGWMPSDARLASLKLFQQTKLAGINWKRTRIISITINRSLRD